MEFSMIICNEDFMPTDSRSAAVNDLLGLNRTDKYSLYKESL